MDIGNKIENTLIPMGLMFIEENKQPGTVYTVFQTPQLFEIIQSVILQNKNGSLSPGKILKQLDGINENSIFFVEDFNISNWFKVVEIKELQ